MLVSYKKFRIWSKCRKIHLVLLTVCLLLLETWGLHQYSISSLSNTTPSIPFLQAKIGMITGSFGFLGEVTCFFFCGKHENLVFTFCGCWWLCLLISCLKMPYGFWSLSLDSREELLHVTLSGNRIRVEFLFRRLNTILSNLMSRLEAPKKDFL